MQFDIFKKFLFAFSALIMFFFGSDPNTHRVLKGLVCLQVFDFLVAMLALIILKEKFNYRKFGQGVIKKVLYLLAVSFGYFIDKYQIVVINNVCFEKAIATAFIAVECCSIAQSFYKAGIKFPYIDKFLKMK